MRFDSGFDKDSRLGYIRTLVIEIYKKRTSEKGDFGRRLHFWFSSDENEIRDIYTNIDESGEHVMVMGIGVVEDIYSYAYTAFSDPAVFLLLGEAGKERNVIVKAAYNGEDIILTGVPEDSRRRDAADKTVEYMLRFIIDHEMSHLTNGHNAYLKLTYGSGMTKLQDDNKNLPNEYNVDRKTLEYDADMSSATAMFVGMIDECKLYDYSMAELEVEDVIFMIGGFAIYSIYALFGRNLSENLLYLSSEERILLIIDNIAELVNEYKYIASVTTGLSYKYALLIKDTVNGCNEAAAFAKKIIDPDLKTYKEIEQQNKDINEHLREVNAEWKRLLQDPDLREAATFNLYDPDAEAVWRQAMGFPDNVHSGKF